MKENNLSGYKKIITFQLDAESASELTDMAYEQKESKSVLIRKALKQYLKRLKDND